MWVLGTALPPSSPKWLCLVSLAAESCSVEASPPAAASLGSLSELDKVQHLRNGVLQVGKLSHHPGSQDASHHAPSARHAHLTSQALGIQSCHQTPAVHPEPSLSCSVTGLTPGRGPWCCPRHSSGQQP